MDIVEIEKAYMKAVMAHWIVCAPKAADEACKATDEAWEAWNEARKAAEETPEYKDWKGKEKAVEEAEEYKDWMKANDAYWEAKVAYWKTSEFKAADEAYSAYLKAWKKSKDEVDKVFKTMPTKFMGKELIDYMREAVIKKWKE